jgi:DNA-binding response OmpR family regulator
MMELNMSNYSILICDDSLEEIRVLISMLKSSDYRLIISSNGKDAFNRAAVLKPDLILLDVRMPITDGFATCRLLKAHSDTRHIPVIFLTAANEVEDRLEGLRIGAVDYIVKPTDVQEVLLRIGIHLRKRVINVDSEENSHNIVTQDDLFVETACRILEENLRQAPTLEELASMVGTHRHRLSELFKHAFGTTVYAWLRERRISQAAEWLESSEMSMQSIADELGFSTSGNFSTAFKDRFGVTPSDYRRTLLKSQKTEGASHLAEENSR